MDYSPILTHPFLGTLSFDPEMVWYTGRIEYDDDTLDFNIGVKDLDHALDDQLTHAQSLFEKRFYQDALNKMIAHLLPIKNLEWLEENEALMSSEEFQDRIEIKGILIYEDGSAEFNIADDGIFWGHNIVIYTDKMGLFEDAHLAE